MPSLFHPLTPRCFERLGARAHRSKTGAPLLAGDPHLGLAIPGIWYVARIKVADRVIEDATTPGVPFIIMGRNNGLAGLTSNEADLLDVIKVGRDDITSRITEVINIDGEFNENVTVSFFNQAPIIIGELAESGDGEGYALLSTALSETTDHPMRCCD